MLRSIRFILAITMLCGAPARAEVPPGLTIAETLKVAEIVDGDTLVLADKRQVRLVGIQAPKLPLGRAGFKAWPLAGAAKAVLEATKGDNAWGSQIRSYVFQPYTMVNDHRTELKVGDVQRIMDGDLDEFITAYLKRFGGNAR